jgi:integrase
MLGMTEEAAWNALRAILASRGVDSPVVTVGAVVAAHLASCERRVGRGELSPLTLASRRSQLRDLEGLAGMPCTELRPHHAAVWLECRPGLCEVSRRVVGSALRAALAWGVSAGMIDRHPLAGWRVPRGLSAHRPLPTDLEVDQVVGCASEEAGVVFRFLASTGARPGEARTIEARHVDGDRVVLPHHKTARATGRPRVIYLREPWPAVLAGLPGPGPLFRRPDGQPWGVTCLSVAWRYAAKRAGVGCHLYSLRHRSITRALVAGVPVPTVAALHGTSIGEIQRTYSHVTSQADHLRESLRRWVG